MNTQRIERLMLEGQPIEALQEINQFPVAEAYEAQIIHQLGRFSQLQREIRKGILSRSEINLTRNQINEASIDLVRKILKEADGVLEANSITQVAGVQTKLHNWDMAPSLQQIIADNRRRRPAIANLAKQLLSDYRAYIDSQSTEPYYDPSKRRWAVLDERFKDLQREINERQKDSVEDIINQITQLLKPRLPEYDALQNAYILAQGRGMSDQYIERNLKDRPADNEVRINIAEKIEEWIAGITVR